VSFVWKPTNSGPFPQPPPLLSPNTQGPTPCPDPSRYGKHRTAMVPSSILKLYKSAKPELARSASPALHWNHSEGSCPPFSLSPSVSWLTNVPYVVLWLGESPLLEMGQCNKLYFQWQSSLGLLASLYLNNNKIYIFKTHVVCASLALLLSLFLMFVGSESQAPGEHSCQGAFVLTTLPVWHNPLYSEPFPSELCPPSERLITRNFLRELLWASVQVEPLPLSQ
jgi:hypothetical protein